MVCRRGDLVEEEFLCAYACCLLCNRGPLEGAVNAREQNRRLCGIVANIDIVSIQILGVELLGGEGVRNHIAHNNVAAGAKGESIDLERADETGARDELASADSARIEVLNIHISCGAADR